MNQNKTYIKYIDSDGQHHWQSISDLLQVGILIEKDSGKDMEISDEFLYKLNDNFAFIPI